jgi:hypothetical protein
MSKITIVDCASRDGVFRVVGKRISVRDHIINCKREYIELDCLGEDGQVRTCDFLNVPREIVLIGAEREVDTEPQASETQGNVVRLSS